MSAAPKLDMVAFANGLLAGVAKAQLLVAAPAIPAEAPVSLDGITADSTPYTCGKCHLSGRRFYEGMWSSGSLICRHIADKLSDAELAELAEDIRHRISLSSTYYVRNFNELHQTEDEVRSVQSSRAFALRFPPVSCKQCGKTFGPRVYGYTFCYDHVGAVPQAV